MLGEISQSEDRYHVISHVESNEQTTKQNRNRLIDRTDWQLSEGGSEEEVKKEKGLNKIERGMGGLTRG